MIDEDDPMFEVCEYYRKLYRGRNLGYETAWISRDSDGKYDYSMEGRGGLSGEVVEIRTTRWDRERMKFIDVVNWDFVGELYEKGLKGSVRFDEHGKVRAFGAGGKLSEFAGSGCSRG